MYAHTMPKYTGTVNYWRKINYLDSPAFVCSTKTKFVYSLINQPHHNTITFYDNCWKYSYGQFAFINIFLIKC